MSIEEIVIAIQNGDTERKEELWQAIYKLMYKFCNKYTYAADKRGYTFEDLVSVSWFGVERAIKAYDTEKGYKFTTYLKYHLMNVIHEALELRGRKSSIRTISLDTPVGEDEDATLGELIEDEHAGEAFETVEDRELYQWVRDMVDTLKPKNKAVIQGIYFDGIERKDYADKLGVSRERMRQIEQTALRELRTKKEIQEYRKEFAYHHVGVKTYDSTWTSTTELAVLKLEDLRRMETEMMKKSQKEMEKIKMTYQTKKGGEGSAGNSYRILQNGAEQTGRTIQKVL